MNFKPTIGLEIHTELKTKTKMFCSCLNDPLEKHPNVNICPVCMGHPGTLPVANKEAIESVIRVGSALHCEIAQYSKFDRKNYFYPDLPKGYQISQYDLPFCKRGYLEINSNCSKGSEPRKIGITRVHLEEDTARLQHDVRGKGTLIDFNRAGVPLMELVTEPDIVSGEEAQAFAQELQLILRYLGVSDADMEKGQMRVEVNISVAPEGKRGTKVEIKNLNSFRSAARSIDYEIKRQSELLENGEKVKQETRGWDEAKQKTVPQRSKEEAKDYRYFPEPDIPPITFTQADIEKIAASVPELPAQKRDRFIKEYGFSVEADVLEQYIQDQKLSSFFEKVVSEYDEWFSTLSEVEKKERYKLGSESEQIVERNAVLNLITNYLVSDLVGLMKIQEVGWNELKITPENFAELMVLIRKGNITSRIAKDILKKMFETGGDPHALVKESGGQISDDSEIEKIAHDIIQNNPKPVEDYKKGKQESLQFLVGQAMKATKGKVNPQKVEAILKKLLM